MMKKWLETMNVQWVVLGTGQADYHETLTDLSRLHPTKLAMTLGFSNDLAHQIESAADIFLMPSQFEPCGLNQMYSMAYGTVPVVRRTGGLADTVIDANDTNIQMQTATGFSFEPYTVEALEATLLRAISMYHEDRSVWNQLIQTGMNADWSWSTSARRYVELYQQTVSLKAKSHQAV
jgi:starch synthase